MGDDDRRAVARPDAEHVARGVGEIEMPAEGAWISDAGEVREVLPRARDDGGAARLVHEPMQPIDIDQHGPFSSSHFFPPIRRSRRRTSRSPVFAGMTGSSAQRICRCSRENGNPETTIPCHRPQDFTDVGPTSGVAIAHEAHRRPAVQPAHVPDAAVYHIRKEMPGGSPTSACFPSRRATLLTRA